MITFLRYLGKTLSLLTVPILISFQQKSLETPPTNVAFKHSSNSVILGEISDDPTEVFESFKPLADYLTKQLTGEDNITAKVEVAPNMETMAKWLKSGKVELYFDSPYPAFLVSQASDAEVILSRWKGGVSAYNSVIITLRDQGIKNINDLRGKTIAFEENFSTSGYILPYSYLKQQGLSLIEKKSDNQFISENEIGYVFSGNDNNSLQWLVSGRVAAMAMGSVDFEKLPAETRQQFIIIGETRSVPRHMVVISPTLSKNKITKLKKILLEMNESESGAKILEQFEETTKFAEIPKDKSDIFQEIRPLINTNIE